MSSLSDVLHSSLLDTRRGDEGWRRWRGGGSYSETNGQDYRTNHWSQTQVERQSKCRVVFRQWLPTFCLFILCDSYKWTQGGGGGGTETDRQTDRQRQRQRKTDTERETHTHTYTHARTHRTDQLSQRCCTNSNKLRFLFYFIFLCFHTA